MNEMLPLNIIENENDSDWKNISSIIESFGVKSEMLNNISTPPTATQHIVDFDASLIYPNVVQSFNSIQKIGMGYYINEVYPFDIKAIHSDNIDDYYRTPTDLYYGNNKDSEYNLIKYERFDRRIDAEKEKLKSLYHYYKIREDDTQASIYFQELKTIEEEHPEWMI